MTNDFIEFSGIKVSPEDAELLYGHCWRINNHGYVVGDKGVLLHRLILMAQPGVFVDHENGDRADNRRENIRLCSHAQNMQNRHTQRNNTSGFPNVYRHGNRWIAEVKANKKRYRKGFQTIEEAAQAAREMVLEHHGEFAKPALRAVS